MHPLRLASLLIALLTICALPAFAADLAGVEIAGKETGTIEGKEFADALWACWVGPKPGPGEDFKNGLLGR